MHQRIDRLSAILIDAVLRNYAADHIADAARALAANHIRFEVALRVLTRPSLRRRAEVSRL
jgi:hypothetical protein